MKTYGNMKHNNNNMTAPATLTVLLAIWVTAVIPLHCTTVPFSLAVAMIVRVEVISATAAFTTVMELAVFVRVAIKLMLSHCGGETLLQPTLLRSVGVLFWNRIPVPEMNGSTIQSRAIPCMTVQV